jgi:hypothetical protein
MESVSVVCVLGMHRSGTSAVTRALNLRGMDLGLPEYLVGLREDNPEGFWENLGFSEVSDEILTPRGKLGRASGVDAGLGAVPHLSDLRRVWRSWCAKTSRGARSGAGRILAPA